MGAVAPLATVAQLFIVTTAAAPGLVAQRNTASAHGARLGSDSAMEGTSAFIATTSFAAPTSAPGLPIFTTTATPATPSTAMAMAGANVWHHGLGHPYERVMQMEMGVNFTDSLTACNICKINKGTKQPISNTLERSKSRSGFSSSEPISWVP